MTIELNINANIIAHKFAEVTCNDNKHEIKDEDEFDVFIERLSQKLANHIINNVKNKQHSIH